MLTLVRTHTPVLKHYAHRVLLDFEISGVPMRSEYQDCLSCPDNQRSARTADRDSMSKHNKSESKKTLTPVEPFKCRTCDLITRV